MNLFGLGRPGAALLAILGWLAGSVPSALAQPVNDAFSAATPLFGTWGSVTGDNSGANSETGEPTHCGYNARASIWYRWTAPGNGEVTLDTLGSSVDTVLAVYTGPGISYLNQVAANDDYYPFAHQTSYYQSSGTGTDYQTGPSILRFNATSNTTYYIAIDSKAIETGPVALSYAYHSSGVFRFASEELDPNSPKPLYIAAPNEGSSIEDASTVETYYTYGVEGLLVTVTRVAGSSGRVLIDYATEDGTAQSNRNYGAVSGTLTFDDFEMSKSILIPIYDGGLEDLEFGVVLSNPQLDPFESSDLSAPRVDARFGRATVRILSEEVATDRSGDGDNAPRDVFNLSRVHYRVPRDVNDFYTEVAIPVRRTFKRSGDGGDGATIHYRVNMVHQNRDAETGANNYFPLSPESDYAINTPAAMAGIRAENPDFELADGTISFPATGGNPEWIRFTVTNDHRVKFAKDFNVILWREGAHGTVEVPGEVNQAYVTVLFEERDAPAGAVDEFYNPDYGDEMVPAVVTQPNNLAKPGTDGMVMGLVVQPDDRSLVAGNFRTYNTIPRNNIARINFDGSLDTTFDPGDGADDFVSALALMPSGQVIIGGAFTAFNGVTRRSIARLNSDGSLDTTFDPGLGANGAVRALAVLASGQILIAGDFTSVSGTNRLHIARLNQDGTLDLTFDPGANGPNGTINALSVLGNGRIVIGGQFTTVNGQESPYLARLLPNGSFDAGFTSNLGAGPDAAVYSIVQDANGRLLVGGSFTRINVTSRGRIARFSAAGVLDTSFDPGMGANDTVFTIVPQGDGTIYVGGQFTRFNGTHRLSFTRLYGDGTVDTTFLDTAYNQFAGLHRARFGDEVPVVYAAGLQTDTNIIIAGDFKQVGGGQANAHVRQDPLDPRSYNADVWTEPKVRSGLRNRYNVARLIGGATPGPGNLSIARGSFSVNKSQPFLPISLVRSNGTLGLMSANFAALTGLSTSGTGPESDFSYYAKPPVYLASWNLHRFLGYNANRAAPDSRMRSDGLFGGNAVPTDIFGGIWQAYDLGRVDVTIKNNLASGSPTTRWQLANPVGADQFFLGGQNIPLGVALGRSVADLTIIDDNQKAGVLSFGAPVFTANENDTNAVITVVRTGGTDGSVAVHYSTPGGTATIGKDYYPVSGGLTFGSGETNKTFNIPLVNNSDMQPQGRTVTLLLSTPGGGATIGLANAQLNIVDDDYPLGYVNLTGTTYTTNENAGEIIVTATRTGGNRGAISVLLCTTNEPGDTAIAGTNYVAVSTNLFWASGVSAPISVRIPLINDKLVGSTTTFTIRLADAIGFGTNAPSILQGPATRAKVSIVDDDLYGNLQFAVADMTVSENGGLVTVPVVRTGGASQTLSVNFATADGPYAYAAGPVPNYQATNGTLTFGPGETFKSFNVRILSDFPITNPPPSEFFFNVTLSGLTPTDATLGYQTSARIHIVDSSSYNQPAGSLDTAFNAQPGFNGDINGLALQPDGQIIAAGNFTLVNGSPRGRVARLNYDASLDNSFLNWSAGANAGVNAVLLQGDGRILIGGAFTQVNGVSRVRVARLQADGTLDSVFNPGAGADGMVNVLAESFIGTNRQVLVGGSFIKFNNADHRGVVRLLNSGALDPSFNPTLRLDGSVYAIAVYPTNTVNGGKILLGGDFTQIDGYSRPGMVRLNQDGTVDVSFDPHGGTTNAVRAIAIQPDGQILIGGSFTNFAGASLNHYGRLNADGTVDSSFQLNGGASDTVSAILLQPDGRILLAGQFTRAAGVSRGRITRLMQDGAVDPNINFGLGADSYINAVALQANPMSAGDGMILMGGSFNLFDGQPRSHLARIYGSGMTGAGSFGFSANDFQVDENATNAVVIVRRLDGTTGTASIDFSTSDGTAVNGVNYSNVTTRLTFAEGETFASVLVPVRRDQQITPDLSVGLTLSNPSEPASVGAHNVATLWVLNDDSAVSFSDASYNVNQDAVGGFAIVNVERQGSSRLTSSIDFYTRTNGTATEGVDYRGVTNVLVFAPGETVQAVHIPILNDAGMLNDKTVLMQLTNGVETLLFSPSQATLNIFTTNRLPGQLMLAETNYVVDEGKGYAAVTVLRTNGNTGTVRVNFATANGSAIAGRHYAQTNGPLSFASGEMSKSIFIPILDDDEIQGAHDFSVTLSSPSGGATLVGPRTATVVITDNEQGVMFQPDNGGIYAMSEASSSVVLTVVRVMTNGTTTVKYTTTNGTAVSGQTYVAKSGSLVFQPGEWIKTFPIQLQRDPRVTGDLYFEVQLFDVSAPAHLGTPSKATVVVLDADPGISIASTNWVVFTNLDLSLRTNAILGTLKSGNQGDTNVYVQVVRTNANTGIVSVNYTTTNLSYLVVEDGELVTNVDNAVPNSDYVPTHGTLTFSNGIALQTIAVPVINNQLFQGDRTFSILLTTNNGTGAAQFIPPYIASVTITDNVAGLHFSSAGYTRNENGGRANIQVWRSGYTNSTVSVDFFTADGTARAGANYFSTNGTLVFTNGETVKSFDVGLVDNSTLDGDLTVLLNLWHVSGVARPTTPSAAVLTILETSGSMVIPAGALLTSESLEVNNIIDPGETVSIMLGLRNAAGTNAANLTARLLPLNGVLNPSPATPVSYGALTTDGPSASRSFNFTANGTNGQVLSAVLELRDGSTVLSNAVFNFVLGHTTGSYSNATSIDIRDSAAAAPYPSIITVGGVERTVTKATVVLTNITHTWPSDINVLLTSPTGERTYLMAKAGGSFAVNNLTLGFDDSAPSWLPATRLSSGTNRATTLYAAVPPPFPLPAPQMTPLTATNLSVFNGKNPNGDWSLFVYDDSLYNSGTISNGWILYLTTAAPVPPAADLWLTMTGPAEPQVLSSNFVYNIHVANYGPSWATNVVVTNVLPPGLKYISSSPAGQYTSNGVGQVVWSLGTLRTNASVEVTLQVQGTAVGVVSNWARAFTLNDPNAKDDAASVFTTIAEASADLGILGFSGLPSPVTLGGTVTYALVITNRGPGTAPQLTLTDTLPVGFELVSASPAGYTQVGQRLTFTNLGNLGRNGSLDASITLRPTAVGTFSNVVSATAGVKDPFKADNSATVKTVVEGSGGVSLTVTASAGGIRLAWPAGSGYVVERTAVLGPEATWTPVSSPAPALIDGSNTLTLPLGSGNQFFRLRAVTP